MWTTDNDHGVQLQFHTGRHVLEGDFPTIGSWVHYGLGSLDDNLPKFIVLGRPIADCCGDAGAHGANYLGPEHSGVQLTVDAQNPLPFAGPGPEEQRAEFELLGRLNRLASVEYPADPSTRARINSYELAFRTQTAVPEIMQFGVDEIQATHRLYGPDRPETKPLGKMCLSARRMVERGVRFVQIFDGSNGGAGDWDAHGGLRTGTAGFACKPIGRLPVSSRISSSAASWMKRSSCGERNSAARPAPKGAMAAIIIPTVSRCGWPAAE